MGNHIYGSGGRPGEEEAALRDKEDADRQGLVYGEEAKVALRNIRRDTMDTFKKEQKAGDLTEDDLKNLEKDVQKLTDDYIKELDKLTAAKERELFEI